MSKDEENLNLLSVLHYVLAGLMALFSLLPFLHLFMGFAVMRGVFGPMNSPSWQGPSTTWMGLFMMVMALVFIAGGWVMAGLVFSLGRMLSRRRGRTYCIVVAAIECAVVPFGTALGVITIVMLMKDSVMELFNGGIREG